MVQSRMLKTRAIELLGGSVSAAADAIGITYQAVEKWPSVLSGRIEDRVVAAIARRYLAPELLGQPAAAPQEVQRAA